MTDVVRSAEAVASEPAATVSFAAIWVAASSAPLLPFAAARAAWMRVMLAGGGSVSGGSSGEPTASAMDFTDFSSVTDAAWAAGSPVLPASCARPSSMLRSPATSEVSPESSAAAPAAELVTPVASESVPAASFELPVEIWREPSTSGPDTWPDSFPVAASRSVRPCSRSPAPLASERADPSSVVSPPVRLVLPFTELSSRSEANAADGSCEVVVGITCIATAGTCSASPRIVSVSVCR